MTQADTQDLLRVAQWLSPAFPVSSYAYSHGLEAEIAAGRVADEASLSDWVSTVLAAGAGRCDAILLCAAQRPDADLDDLGDLARALAGSAERWEETRAQGAAFAETQNAMSGQDDFVPMPYPVAVGVAARGLQLSPEALAALYLQGFAAALVSVAVRFVPLGQAAGQRVLAGLHPVIQAVAAEVASLPENGLQDALGGAAFGADLAAMEHEGLEVRLFRT